MFGFIGLGTQISKLQTFKNVLCLFISLQAFCSKHTCVKPTSLSCFSTTKNTIKNAEKCLCETDLEEEKVFNPNPV